MVRHEPAPPVGCGCAPDDVTVDSDADARRRLFEAFVACRTTLDDLSDRTARLGEDIAGSAIAAHLTGRSSLSDASHNAVAAAINARLAELSLPATAPYTQGANTVGIGLKSGVPAPVAGARNSSHQPIMTTVTKPLTGRSQSHPWLHVNRKTAGETLPTTRVLAEQVATHMWGLTPRSALTMVLLALVGAILFFIVGTIPVVLVQQ